jgi:hypothetical protein
MIRYNVITRTLDNVDRRFVGVDYFNPDNSTEVFTALVSLNDDDWQLETEDTYPEWFAFDQEYVVFSCASLDELVNMILKEGEFGDMTLLAIDQDDEDVLATVQDLAW